ncbi:racemase (plasmid) [Rhodococcus qingshengii]|uniref:mandelate racemase/muconate lactonizing enzyme family protein n=1 Tax=Rhodococcus qingshengii TaxID=334542 RepID=UPI0007E586D9|nr:mandelate racemase/muconate lactonizing enzyme family protein [Rhodococcus qingshengii]BCF86402.1 racemase [Rhodococcus qingshengii]
MSAITRIDTYACRVPLDHPIKFKWNTITHRDYTVVRVETADGLTGASIGLSRTSPIDVAINDLIAPVALGTDSLEIGAFHESLRQHTASSDQFGILAPARSLVDIALWDIRGKALGAPVWKLLGGNSQPAEVLLVEGYELPGETDEGFARRLAERASEGYVAIKLEAAGYEDPQILRRRLQLTREYAGEELKLIVDVNGAWRSVREAAETINAISDTQLAWVEDPFPRHRIADVAKLRDLVDVPLSAGDDITDPRVLMDLVLTNAVDVLRVDVTTLGGFAPTIDVIGVARQFEVPVSTHAHPILHQHLSFAWPEVHYVEAFPDDRPFEPSYKLGQRSTFSRIENGRLPAPLEPGLALELDMKVVESTALRRPSATY